MGMTYRSAAIWIAVIIVLLLVIMYGPTLYKRERPSGYSSGPVSRASPKGGYPLNAPPLPLRRVAKKEVAGKKHSPLEEDSNWMCAINLHPCPKNMRMPISNYISQRKSTTAKGHREGYGPPPGMARAIDQSELPYLVGDRGWATWPKEYEGSSAGSMAAFIERSA